MSAQAGTGQTIVIAGRVFRRPTIQANRIDWLWLGLMVMLVFYWIIVVLIERIDGGLVLARLFRSDVVANQVPSHFLYWLMRTGIVVFHPRVLRYFIPVVVGWWLSVEAATSLIQVLYDCPDRATARDFLRRQRRRGQPPSGEALAVTPQTLHRIEDESVHLRIGGPAAVVLTTGHASVTEWNSRFARVTGSGMQKLGSFEHIHSIISLQPQERTATRIPLMTKEGINVTTDAHIIFRIEPGEDGQTRNRPFPYDPAAVRKAAYSVVVQQDGTESSWDKAPMGKVRGTLSGIVSQYRLDELIFPASPVGEPHHSIRTKVELKVRADLSRNGIQFVRLDLGRFEPPAQVSEQYTDFWLANWEKQNRIALAGEEASALEEQQVSHAEAEIAMLQAVVESVRRAQNENDDASGYLLALRLIETLDKMVKQAQDRLPAPGKGREQVLPRLKKLQDQLARVVSNAQQASSASPGPPQDKMNVPDSD